MQIFRAQAASNFVTPRAKSLHLPMRARQYNLQILFYFLHPLRLYIDTRTAVDVSTSADLFHALLAPERLTCDWCLLLITHKHSSHLTTPMCRKKGVKLWYLLHICDIRFASR